MTRNVFAVFYFWFFFFFETKPQSELHPSWTHVPIGHALAGGSLHVLKEEEEELVLLFSSSCCCCCLVVVCISYTNHTNRQKPE